MVLVTKMGKYRCWVPHCPNGMKKFRKENVRLFCFPGKDIERCRKWVQAVGYEDFVYMPKETLAHRYVCIDHFTEDDVLDIGVRRKLSLAAVPSKFPNGHVPLSDELASEWPPKLEWECGEPEPRKPKPQVIREAKICIPCPDCEPTTPSDNPESRKRTICSSHSQAKAKKVSVSPQCQSEPIPQPIDDADGVVIDSEKSQDVSSLGPAAAGLQEGDELLGFIVRRGSEVKIIPLEDESMMVAIHN